MRRVLVSSGVAAAMVAALDALAVETQVEPAVFELHAPPDVGGHLPMATKNLKSKCKKIRREARGW